MPVLQSRVSNSASAAFASDVTAGNLLVAFISNYGAVTGAAPTDTLGSTWSLAITEIGGQQVKLFYAVAAGSGPCTVTFGGFTPSFPHCGILEATGVQAVLDGTPAGSTYGTDSAGSLTTTTTNALVIVGLGGYETASAWTGPAGWTITQATGSNGGTGIAWTIQSSPGTVNPSFPDATDNNDTKVIVAFGATGVPTPRAAIGTKLKKGDGASPETFTTVAIVGNIDGPSLKADTIDTTNHDNADSYKTFIVTLLEGGDVKLQLFFDPTEATHTALITDHQARTLRNWKIDLPISPAHGWSFAGYITDISNKYEIKGALMADCTIKVSGKPVFA